MPIHWATFRLAPHPWSEPVERLSRAADAEKVQVAVPKPGQRVAPGRGAAARPVVAVLALLVDRTLACGCTRDSVANRASPGYGSRHERSGQAWPSWDCCSLRGAADELDRTGAARAADRAVRRTAAAGACDAAAAERRRQRGGEARRHRRGPDGASPASPAWRSPSYTAERRCTPRVSASGDVKTGRARSIPTPSSSWRRCPNRWRRRSSRTRSA